MSQLDLSLRPALPPNRRFSGASYEERLDQGRLTTQLDHVLVVVLEADRYWTVPELTAECRRRWPDVGFPETSVSAQLRNARKKRLGGYLVDPRRRGDPKSGLWEYRVRRPA